MKTTDTDFMLRALAAYPMDPGLALHRACEAKLVTLERMVPPVLDLGCHDGTFANLALNGREHGPTFGADTDAAGLERARSAGQYAGLVRCDVTFLPFAARSFGTVLANSFLAHVADLDAGLHEIARVLRPGGRLLATVPTPRFHAMSAPTRTLTAVGLSRAATAVAQAYDRAWTQRNFLDRAGWAGMLTAGGLTPVQWTEYLDSRASWLWSGAFLLTRAGVGRVTLGALLRHGLPLRLREALQRRWAERLAHHVGATDIGGSALLVAEVAS